MLVTLWVAVRLMRAILLVAATLAALLLFFDLLDGLEKLTKEGWSFARLSAYVLALQPGRWLELIPIAVLVGSAAGLLELARSRELTVLRASGLTPWGLWYRVALPAVCIALVALALGEWLVPASERFARQLESESVSSEQQQKGLWLAEERAFVHLALPRTDQTLPWARWYRFAAEGTELVAIETGYEGVYDQAAQAWRFARLLRYSFDADGLQQSQTEGYWAKLLDPETLAVVWLEPARMGVAALWRYTAFVQQHGVAVEPYALAFWRRLFLPLTLLALATLAIPFALNLGRTAHVAPRLFLATLLGVAFYLVTRLTERLVQLNLVEPFEASFVPTLLIALAAAAIWWYAERR